MSEAVVPAMAGDIAESPRAAPEAEAAFNALPPSHRAEYVTWIEEAETPETRARRIRCMLERLR